MTYAEAKDFLFYQLPMFQRTGPKAFKKDLTNILALCERLGNPQDNLTFIHLAGTNGKGSTSHILASILQANNKKVGLYTSPHYKDYRERIKINSEFIDKRFVVNFVKWFQKEASDIKVSFFELTVAMAFCYFEKQKVDLVVLETGLGGRLDSTNIVNPILSIITNISKDHTNFLGDTIEAIAKEKAGIIKKDIPVLIGRRQKETSEVFAKYAEINQSRLFYVEDLIEFISAELAVDSMQIKAKINSELIDIKTSFSGKFQIENCMTAIASALLLNKYCNYNINVETIINGLRDVHKNTYFIGRWMCLNKAPMILADSAHNIDGVSGMLEEVRKIKFDQLHFVLAFVGDKSIDDILPLFPKSAKYYFSSAKIPRAKNKEELQSEANMFGLKGKTYSSVKMALAAAKKSAKKTDLIYCGGSIFTIAEVI